MPSNVDDVKRQVITGMIENRCTQHMRERHPEEFREIWSKVKEDTIALDKAYNGEFGITEKEERP